MPDNVEANGAEVSDAMSENEHEYDESDRPIKEDEDESMAEQHTSPEPGVGGSGEVKKKYDPKDPHRPRRKKARRACYACQRAHLTCAGDERPCQRCIKRGLADACQDGVRKKAKYLHDAPPEALRPVLGPTYNPNMVSKSANGRHPSNATSASEASAFYPQTTSSQTYPLFTGGQPQVSMPDNLFAQPSPVSPSFQQQTAQRSQQMGNMQMPTPSSSELSYPNALFDPSNPAIFNFDLEGLQFGSHYGAMEFGILGQMSSGAAETPPRDASLSQQGNSEVNYNGGQMYPNGLNSYNQLYDGMIENYMNSDQNNGANNLYSQGNLQHGLPHAYAIAAAGPTPSSLASPGTDHNSSPQPTNLTFDGSPNTGNFTPVNSQSLAGPPKSRTKTPANANAKLFGPQSILTKRQRDPSAIYENVKEPYQYLTGFHNLIALVKRRFSSAKTTRIAMSLASIRPSFISCTRNLNRQDLIFMEKCLQRTLFEYEDFMGHCSAPTVVCRRTGEVAAVNKEFVALTGWTKDVLLGKQPNLNVNSGDTSGSASGVNTGKGGLTTPQLKAMEPVKTGDKPQPVFIAELMDDDSVIQFYEDFAQLAFGDSRGHVTRKCRLLKYRTKEVMESLNNEDSPPQKDPRHSILSSRVTRIDGEHGISKIEKDGKMDCSYTWTIKRDVFDIPMLIVINFLPCYYRNQDQLAI
ncbi:hypothetical protein PFICI_10093 [Pestalotiopsis fici W106-1]|uniref:Zn(2)-C6 fungal-type domain-containing protein n=1 Tax=Pestalotiopsis fici (strain W106-1 / CGMCC3.15140) TaxID=1229662 RepID=W3WYQ3_PESFW|nr:uncharacterized protein PFICI_10093 [Pestalotiopsis fici W106-1]ETS78031.1 hypothetical protein PFICI_10093 [Pestalotiopsis fici W106-1]